jgi:hypothetical protein
MTAADLSTLPLHVITETYGESGLRERFAHEVLPFPEPARADLGRALDLAAELHRHDRRMREPYLNHPLRVAIRIINYYGVRDADVVAAALLHDAVEDHPDELAGKSRKDTAGVDAVETALAVLADRFNLRVADLVRAVTNPAYDRRRDKHEQYREHVAESLDRNPWARVIKVSDFTDNGVGIVHATGPKVALWAAKYNPLVPTFRELITRPDTPLSDTAKRHILDQLDLAEQRFAAILKRLPSA